MTDWSLFIPIVLIGGIYDALVLSSWLGILLYATLFTSIWVWLYALAGGLVRLAAMVQPGLRFLKWALDIDGHPVRSLGAVAGALACLAVWGMALVRPV